MVSLTEKQHKIAKLALQIILKRKRKANILGIPYNHAITNAASIVKDDDPASQYEYLQICKAIVIPNAILFFSADNDTGKGSSDRLATFIENNSFSVTF